MSRRKKLLIGIIGFIIVCFGVSCQADPPDSEDEAEPTAVALVEEVQPTATASTDTSEPTPTNTRTPRPTATSTPEIETAAVIDPAGNEVSGETAVVTQIIDGDTIDVEINGETYRVRYIGMDTPERDEPLFMEAAEANARLVANQTVILVKDVSETDRYGRLLRYVYLEDGTFVNGELVRKGYAQASTYPPDVAFQDTFTDLQRTAVNAGIGLWASPTVAEAPTNTAVPQPLPTAEPTTAPEQPQPTSPPAPPTEAPQPTSPPTEVPAPTEAPPPSPGVVAIVGVNKRDEYVDIQNQGGTDVDLNGWVLLSEKGSQSCNLGGVIAAGQTLRIWAMASDAGNGGFNCGFGSNIWNNSESDPAVLFDPSGNAVSRW